MEVLNVHSNLQKRNRRVAELHWGDFFRFFATTPQKVPGAWKFVINPQTIKRMEASHTKQPLSQHSLYRYWFDDADPVLLHWVRSQLWFNGQNKIQWLWFWKMQNSDFSNNTMIQITSNMSFLEFCRIEKLKKRKFILENSEGLKFK